MRYYREEGEELIEELLDGTWERWNRRFPNPGAIAAAIEILEEEREAEREEADSDVAGNGFTPYGPGRIHLLAELQAFASELEDCNSDWEEEQLIHENDFEEAMKEQVEEAGYLPRDLPWWIEVNWKATAENLRQDYMEVTFRENNFYLRSY